MAEETSAVSKWKPVKVKVNNWGVDFDYVLTLAPRDGIVADLQREIKRTLQKVLPSERTTEFTHILKEDGRVFLPPWYCIELSLRDDERVLLGYCYGEISRKGPSEQPVISGEVSDIHRFTETDNTTTIASTSNSRRLLDDAPIIASNTEQEECSFMLSTKAVDEKPPRAANMTGEVEAAEQSGLMMRCKGYLQAREATEITSSLVAGEVFLDKQDDKSKKRKHKKAKREDVEFQTAINDEAITDQESSESRKRSKKRRKEKNGTDTIRTEELSGGSRRKETIKTDYKAFKFGIAETTDIASTSNSCRLLDDSPIITSNTEQEKRSFMLSTKTANMTGEVEAAEQSGLKKRLEGFKTTEFQTAINDPSITGLESSESRKRSKKRRKEKNGTDTVRTEELSDGSKRKKKIETEDKISEGGITNIADDELVYSEMVVNGKIIRYIPFSRIGDETVKDSESEASVAIISPTVRDKSKHDKNHQNRPVIRDPKKTWAESCESDKPSCATFSDISATIVKLEIQKKDPNETKEAEETVNQSTKEDKSEAAERNENTERKTKRKKRRKNRSSRSFQETKEAEETVNQSTKEDKSELAERDENNERKIKRKKSKKNKSSRSSQGDLVGSTKIVFTKAVGPTKSYRQTSIKDYLTARTDDRS